MVNLPNNSSENVRQAAGLSLTFANGHSRSNRQAGGLSDIAPGAFHCFSASRSRMQAPQTTQSIPHNELNNEAMLDVLPLGPRREPQKSGRIRRGAHKPLA